MTKYLYNGVELPALPEWDKETYPYAMIYEGTFGGFALFLTDVPGTFESSAVTHYNVTKAEWGCSQTDTVWTEYSASSHKYYDRFISTSTNFVWSNYDILNKDGTLYLAASDPIPVGSAPEVEPKSFMAGWRMGQFVRAML